MGKNRSPTCEKSRRRTVREGGEEGEEKNTVEGKLFKFRLKRQFNRVMPRMYVDIKSPEITLVEQDTPFLRGLTSANGDQSRPVA